MMYVFYKKLPTYNPQKTGIQNQPTNDVKETNGRIKPDLYGDKYRVKYEDKGDRHPKSVIQCSNKKGKHPTQKPLALCTTLIKACKLKGEPTLVVIPFAGSGAECLACHQMEDVNYIGYEINPMYVELCTRKVV